MNEIDVVGFRNNESQENEIDLGVNINIDLKGDVNPYADGVEPVDPVLEEKKRRGRKKKTDNIIKGENKVTPLNEYIETNAQYINSYDESNAILRGTIAQLDNLSGLVNDQLNQIVQSKTLKKKYDYISELTSTSASIINNKITAVREINKSITDSHNLEIKRIKDLKMAQAAAEKDDDRRMQEMYAAFVATPTNMGPALGPAINELSLGPTSYQPQMYSDDAGLMNYMNNLTPEQNRMRMEDAGIAETVLLYDPMTGARQFQVIDKNTGQPIPNMPLPSDIILENTQIDTRTGLARNRDINTSYRIITMGDNPVNHL